MLGQAWASPTLARVSLYHHFTSINDRKWTLILTSSCATQTFYIISKIYHNYIIMVVGSSVSWKAYDKVFLNPRMTLWMAIIYYVIIVSRKHTKFYWMTIANMAIWSPVVWKLCNTTFVKLQGMYGYIAWGLNNYIA